MLRAGSLFAGIGGIDLAFERAGARVAWNCEIDASCRKVLAHHWPGVPRFKDVRTVTGEGLRAAGLSVDVVAGGFPCQDVSVAGARAGLAGERSGLFYEFARVLDEARPAWCLVENVPGLLSSHGGGDMGTVLGILADLGYGLAWRVLDAQYFGVAQRRRRVFIVGCLGDRARAAQVLLEPEGGGGDPPARNGAQPGVATGTGGCIAGGGDLVTGLTGSFGNGGADDNKAQAGWLIPAVSKALVATSTVGHHFDPKGEALIPMAYRKATTSHGPDNDWERWEEAAHSNTLDAGSNVTRNAHVVLSPVDVDQLHGIDTDQISHGVGVGGEVAGLDELGLSGEGVADQGGEFISGQVGVDSGGDRVGRHSQEDDKPARDVNGNLLAVVQPAYGLKEANRQANGWGVDEERAYTLDGQGRGSVAAPDLAVRRLTPLECLRLQGFPDDWLDGLGLADSVKYRMVGNAVAVPVVAWIARRLLAVHEGPA